MLSSRSSLALMAALALSAGAAPIVLADRPALISTAPRRVRASKRSLSGGIRSSTVARRGKNPAVTAAHQKRLAHKTRNVARNRRHHR